LLPVAAGGVAGQCRAPAAGSVPSPNSFGAASVRRVSACIGPAAPQFRRRYSSARLLQDRAVSPRGGFGIVVCEPIAAHADDAMAAFGSGCAAWLQMTVGGLPQLGKTPLWNALPRATAEIGHVDLRLARVQAVGLGPALGITHVAVGTISGAASHCTLTYQLYAVPSGKTVGRAWRVQGSRADILRQLPAAVKRMAQTLGVNPVGIPATMSGIPDDFALLGRLRWSVLSTRTPAQAAAFRAMALRVPLAGLMTLSRDARTSNARFFAATDALLAQGEPIDVPAQKQAAFC